MRWRDGRAQGASTRAVQTGGGLLRAASVRWERATGASAAGHMRAELEASALSCVLGGMRVRMADIGGGCCSCSGERPTTGTIWVFDG